VIAADCPRIVFTDGWKYQLERNYTLDVGIHLAAPLSNRWSLLLPDGRLTIMEAYCWDGPSGPTIDSDCFMRGSLVHDALYQLMREGLLPITYREHADRLLQRLCLEDGMTRLRAWWVYQGVRRFGGPCADASHIKPVRYAPARPGGTT